MFRSFYANAHESVKKGPPVHPLLLTGFAPDSDRDNRPYKSLPPVPLCCARSHIRIVDSGSVTKSCSVPV